MVVLVTGASSGMGFATVKRLLKDGHTVYAAARRVEKMQPLSDLGAKILPLDVTDDNSMISVVNSVIENDSRIDVLFNNAGYGSFGAVEDVPIEEAKSQFEVNLFGLARMTQLVLPHMREQNSGMIINNGSMGGKMYSPLGAWYHATKYSIEGFTDCLRFEVEPFNIKVVLIEPGNIDSPWNDIMLQHAKKASGDTAYKPTVNGLEKLMNHIGRFSSPELIADTVAKAIRYKHPKTRYLVGKNSKLFVFTRFILTDKMYDRIMKMLTK